jgi:hypothetical protein
MMDIKQTGLILAKIALIEGREATNETIRAWHEILEIVNFEDAMEALVRHYRNSTESCKPAHIMRGAREVKEERKKRIIT